MKLHSFGCSFIFGSELANENDSWPARLSRHLGFEYQCHARPGSGNLHIAETVLNQLAQPDQAFFIIGWTWIDRFDYVNAHTNQWSTILPTDTDSTAQNYYKRLHSEHRDKLTNLMTIKLIIDQLSIAKIPYLMTHMDELLFDQRWHTSPAITDLQRQIRPCMTMFEGKTFLDWSRAHGYAESQLWHPLEEAHQAAADYMIKIFDKQKTSDPVQQVRA